MGKMKDIDILLKQSGWVFECHWWRNPRFPGKKYGYLAAVKIQERLEGGGKNPAKGLGAEEPKEIPYWKIKRGER